MLEYIFRTVIKMNFAASAAAAAVLVLKFVMQKLGCPRRVTYFLWAVIAFRLICPVFPASQLSMFNLFSNNVKTEVVHETGIAHETAEVYTPTDVSNSTHSAPQVFPVIWLCGFCAVLAAGACSALRLKKRLRFAVKYRDNIFTDDNIPTSFVFGILNPKIYIPSATEEENLSHIITHEQTHISRLDHITKPAAFILLAVHWFNPLNILLFKLFSDDTELCCDEAVLEKIGSARKKEYAGLLLRSASAPARNIVYLCTAGFSGSITKHRIKNAVKYKSRCALCKYFSALICLAFAVSLCTNAAPQTAAVLSEPPAPVQTPMSTAPPIENEVAEITPTPLPSSTATPTPLPAAVPETEMTLSPSPSASPVNLPAEATYTAPAIAPIAAECKSIIGKYSYKSNCESYEKNIRCDAEGNISVFLESNMKNLVRISFYDSASGEELYTFITAADNKTVHVFPDFNPLKTYDVKIKGETGSDWKIEGTYKIN